MKRMVFYPCGPCRLIEAIDPEPFTVPGFEEFDLFTHRVTLPGFKWHVAAYHASCGSFRISDCGWFSREAAIRDAVELLTEKGLDCTRKAFKREIAFMKRKLAAVKKLKAKALPGGTS